MSNSHFAFYRMYHLQYYYHWETEAEILKFRLLAELNILIK